MTTTTLVRSADGTAVVGSVTGPHSNGQWVARDRTTGRRHRCDSYADAVTLLRRPPARRNHPAGRNR